MMDETMAPVPSVEPPSNTTTMWLRFERLVEERQKTGLNVGRLVVDRDDGRQHGTVSICHERWLDGWFSPLRGRVLPVCSLRSSRTLGHGWVSAASHRRG